jgi:hypothetical protein
VFWELRLLGLPLVSVRLSEAPEGTPRYDLSGGDFERDTEPLSPSNEEPYYEEDRFGFR